MNANLVKEKIAALREKIEQALRAADTTIIASTPSDIDEITKLVDGQAEPVNGDGEPWAPNVGGGDETPPVPEENIGGEPEPKGPETDDLSPVAEPPTAPVDASPTLHPVDGDRNTA